MYITIEYTPPMSDKPEYQKLLKKLFPTTPLYIFLSVSAALLVLMVIQHIYNASSWSLVFISLSVLFLLFGGSILRATKKSFPVAESELMASLGKKQSFTFTDTEVHLGTEGGKTITYPRTKLIGQYCTDKHYIFCFANRPALVTVVVGISQENIKALNTIVQSNSSCGIKLKKLKVK